MGGQWETRRGDWERGRGKRQNRGGKRRDLAKREKEKGRACKNELLYIAPFRPIRRYCSVVVLYKLTV